MKCADSSVPQHEELGTNTVDSSGPRITSVAVAAAHDGSTELVVRLRHPNGGEELVVLDESTAARVLARCGIDDPALLLDRSWRELLVYPED